MIETALWILCYFIGGTTVKAVLEAIGWGYIPPKDQSRYKVYEWNAVFPIAVGLWPVTAVVLICAGLWKVYRNVVKSLTGFDRLSDALKWSFKQITQA